MPAITTTGLRTVDVAPSERLRLECTGLRKDISRLSTVRAFTDMQLADAAACFEAESRAISASKKLYDPKFPPLAAVNSILNRVEAYWKFMTLPYPEKATRLLPLARIEKVDRDMAELQQELDEAKPRLRASYPELVERSRVRLRHLFNPAEYDPELVDKVGFRLEPCSINAPAELERFPEIFAKQRAEYQAKLDLALGQFTGEICGGLSLMMTHLVDTLTGKRDDGKPKIIRADAFDKLKEFVARAKDLNLTGDPQITALTDDIAQIVGGVDPTDLRRNDVARSQVAAQFQTAIAAIDALTTARPLRRLGRELMDVDSTTAAVA
jgi:hypothetical protein